MIVDAYGRPVEQLGTCERCGATIKYIFVYDGKTYGSTCIEAVSGIRPDNWVMVDGRYDEQATRQSLVEREAIQQARVDRETALQAKREAIRQTNREQFAELVNVLRNTSRYNGDFCSNMANDIESNGFDTDLHEILSHNCYTIVREIYGKAVGGRRNSKAYNAAVDEFDQKYSLDYEAVE